MRTRIPLVSAAFLVLGLAACNGDETEEPAKNPLTISTLSLANGQEGVAYSATIGARDGSNSGYTWSVSRGVLPAGLTLESSGTPSTSLSGTPSQNGSFAFTVTVKDSAGEAAQQAYSINITPGEDALTIVTTSLPGGMVGVPYNAALVARGGSTTGFTWSLVSGALPDGLTLSAAGAISGTPLVYGAVNFVLQVEDSDGDTDRSNFVIDVQLPSVLRLVTAETLSAGQVNVPYSQLIEAEGGSGDYRWTLTSGLLPPGLTLSSTGTPSTRINGRPMAEGTYRFAIFVEDNIGANAEREYFLAISAAPPELVITTTSTLPAGAVSAPYSATIEATGGSGSGYDWSIVSGTIPPGLTIPASGTPSVDMTGTPTTAGDFAFMLRVTDSLTLTSTAPFNLYISP